MKASIRYWTMKLTVIACVIALITPGCATTKNVMNKATFGLIGGGQESGDTQAGAEQESKADRKKREKEEKQQREAEKRAAKEDENARKSAAKEEKKNDEKPGLMSRMTFGLVGGKKSADDERQQAEARTAAKEQKRQEKEAREQQKRDEKAAKAQQKREAEAQKKEEKLAAKERQAQEKQAKLQERQSASDQKAAESEKTGPTEKRSLMSRMTFGLVGGKQPEKSDKSGPSDASAPSTGPSREDEEVQKRAEKEQRKAEKQAKKDAEKAEKEQARQTKAEENQTEEAAPAGEPKEKRSLMSRMTFGLVGGKKPEQSDSSGQSNPSDQSGNLDKAADSSPGQPTLPPEQLAMTAPSDAQYDVEPASALDGEARKLAKMPFKTSVDLSTKSASGKGQATASRETYSRNGYGITDIGDVRIAVQGMTFDGESRAGGIVISSDDRAAVGGKAGTGNSAFVYEYAKGVTAVQFGTVNFTIAKSVISIGGKSVPIGQGKKLIVVDGQGNVIGAYAVE